MLSDALRLAPGLGTMGVIEWRVGFRPLAADLMPLLGPVPGIPGLFVATDLGGTGLTLGPPAGFWRSASWVSPRPWTWPRTRRCAASLRGASARGPAVRRDEPIHVFLVVVDVRADPQPAEAGGGEDLLLGQPLREPVGHAGGIAQTQDVGSA